MIDSDDVRWDTPKIVKPKYAVVYPDIGDGWTVPWTYTWDSETNEWTYRKHNRRALK